MLLHWDNLSWTSKLHHPSRYIDKSQLLHYPLITEGRMKELELPLCNIQPGFTAPEADTEPTMLVMSEMKNTRDSIHRCRKHNDSIDIKGLNSLLSWTSFTAIKVTKERLTISPDCFRSSLSFVSNSITASLSVKIGVKTIEGYWPLPVKLQLLLVWIYLLFKALFGYLHG